MGKPWSIMTYFVLFLITFKGDLAISMDYQTDEDWVWEPHVTFPPAQSSGVALCLRWPWTPGRAFCRCCLHSRGHARVSVHTEGLLAGLPGRPAGLSHSIWRGHQREDAVTETSVGWLKGKALAESKTSWNFVGGSHWVPSTCGQNVDKGSWEAMSGGLHVFWGLAESYCKMMKHTLNVRLGRCWAWDGELRLRKWV